MKVAVFEYLSGGGLINDANSPSRAPRSRRSGLQQPKTSMRTTELLEPLYLEGLSMLTALATDLAFCGHEVHTCLDRKAAVDPMVESLLQQFSGLQVHKIDCPWLDRWIDVALACDRTIVIAPELHQHLERIINALRTAGAAVIASSTSFIQATSDKLKTAKLLTDSGVPHPRTQSLTQYRLGFTEPEALADSLRRGSASASGSSRSVNHGRKSQTAYLSEWDKEQPVTLKRRDGAGCADMKVFADPRKLTEWLRTPESHDLAGEEWIIQPWQPGIPASLALIADDDAWTVLGAAEQQIELASESNHCGYAYVSYLGGTGPLRRVSLERLEHLAMRVRDSLPLGAKGWIGIDFLIPDEMQGSQNLVVIEINPRLTTSYLGYRRWYGHALANSLVGNVNCSELKPKTICQTSEPSSWDCIATR
ncbi:MAG TPA: ATP-grasp domain-containing protein [Pirellula sp.]|nr:ATP-grasp domain-containing protein [Pirellula sp.]